MALPNKIKKYIPLKQPVSPYERREELLEMIKEKGTFLPKSLLHAELDGGFLEFVKDQLSISVSGKKVPTLDILITTQNWAQFVETWDFQNLDKNLEPPFVVVVRTPEVKFGDPSIKYNIPNRKLYHYAEVPTWDGQRHGIDIYKIPQPVPVQITYTVIIVCNRMRELNKFNKTVIEKFASRQAYQVINGHYIPIVLNEVTDESVFDVEKRKMYIQKYGMTLQGFLLDEDEFEVSPAIVRTFQVYEVDDKVKSKKKKRNPETPSDLSFSFPVNKNTFEIKVDYTTDMTISSTENIDEYTVYINEDFYGTDLQQIQVNTNDIIRINVIKKDNTQQSLIVVQQKLI